MEPKEPSPPLSLLTPARGVTKACLSSQVTDCYLPLGHAPNLGRTLAKAYDLVVAKGWERASVDLYSRPDRVQRDIRREDLLAPADDRTVFLLGACLLCGAMLSVLYVLFPLLLITFAGFDLGGWLMGSVLVGALASAIILFVAELRVRRDFANEL